MKEIKKPSKEQIDSVAFLFKQLSEGLITEEQYIFRIKAIAKMKEKEYIVPEEFKQKVYKLTGMGESEIGFIKETKEYFWYYKGEANALRGNGGTIDMKDLSGELTYWATGGVNGMKEDYIMLNCSNGNNKKLTTEQAKNILTKDGIIFNKEFLKLIKEL